MREGLHEIPDTLQYITVSNGFHQIAWLHFLRLRCCQFHAQQIHHYKISNNYNAILTCPVNLVSHMEQNIDIKCPTRFPGILISSLSDCPTLARLSVIA